MIGSLGEFIQVEADSILTPQQQILAEQFPPVHLRGKSTFEGYAPDDKTRLLQGYQRNNLFSINRKKYNSIAKEVKTSERTRKPLVQHHSFFVKSEVARDSIAREELKRKHNLLRAILRMEKNEEQPNRESDYEQSFQRLYSGFQTIHPQPVLTMKQSSQDQPIPAPKQLVIEPPPLKSRLGKQKRLQYEHCLSWANKHNMRGDFFASQLGKQTKERGESSDVLNRSLLEQINRRGSLSWLE